MIGFVRVRSERKYDGASFGEVLVMGNGPLMSDNKENNLRTTATPDRVSVNMHQGLLQLFHIFKTESRRSPLVADNIDIRSPLSSSR